MNNKELEKRIENLEELVKELRQDVCCQINKTSDNEISQQHEFKVGDRVQFKSWEEMGKKYGADRNGDLYMGFLKEMKHLCNTYATISSINGFDVKLCDFTAIGDVDWGYDIDMLKPATDEPKFKAGDKVRILNNANYYVNKIGEVKAHQKGLNNSNHYLVELEAESCWYKEQDLQSYTEPRWTFTDDEKVILRNLPEGYKWIARDKCSRLWVCSNKPYKEQESWANGVFWENLTVFFNLFQSIKWEDNEPCEFRKFI